MLAIDDDRALEALVHVSAHAPEAKASEGLQRRLNASGFLERHTKLAVV